MSPFAWLSHLMVETRLWMDSHFMLVKHQNLFVKKHLATQAPKDLIAHVSPNLPFQLWLTFWEKYMETSFIRRQLSNQISTSVIHPWSRNLHQARFFSVKSWLRSGFHEPPMQARMEKNWRKSMGWKIFRIKPFETSPTEKCRLGQKNKLEIFNNGIKKDSWAFCKLVVWAAALTSPASERSMFFYFSCKNHWNETRK